MNFISIRDAVCAKVSKTDPYSQDRCTDYIKARDKMIYDSFDWKAAQIIVEKTITAGAGTTTTVSVPEVHHAISVRLDGKLLDPVSASFIFENATATRDDYSTAGTPLYYDEQLDLTSGTRKVRLFPPLADDGINHSLVVLGKAPYSDAWTSPAIPATESALIAFVIGDMWEYLHAVQKSQAKLQEAVLILKEAQSQDTPALRPRSTRNMTPSGNSLRELTDAVCDMIGDWTPQTRTSVKDRIRRNHSTVWDSAAFPETVAMATVTAANNVAIIPHLIDKIIGVRVNVDASHASYRTLDYTDTQLFLGISPEIFESTGEPLYYSLLLPTALPTILNEEIVKFILTGNEKADAFIKGELRGVEQFETVKASNVAASTVNLFDNVLTITKPVTKYSLRVQNLSGTTLMELGPGEQERKYARIRLFPQFDVSADQTVFVLGKRKCPQLMDDGDTCQLTGIENILINGAAADMLLGAKPEVAASLQKKAAANLQVLVDREMKQQTYAPRIVPYTEPSAMISSFTDTFIG